MSVSQQKLAQEHVPENAGL